MMTADATLQPPAFFSGHLRISFRIIIFLGSFHCCRLVLSTNTGITKDQIESTLKEEDIYPDIVQTIPSHIVEISYSGRCIRFGEFLKNESIARNQPTKLTWPYDRKELYLILMTDPDGPTWTRPGKNEWHHWLIGNIWGNDFEEGEILSQYIGPIPGQGSRVHRYILMVFQQPSGGDLAFTELERDERPVNRLRGYFSTKNFATKYNLTVIAINYFQINWGKSGLFIKPRRQKPRMNWNATQDDSFMTMIPFA